MDTLLTKSSNSLGTRPESLEKDHYTLTETVNDKSRERMSANRALKLLNALDYLNLAFKILKTLNFN